MSQILMRPSVPDDARMFWNNNNNNNNNFLMKNVLLHMSGISIELHPIFSLLFLFDFCDLIALKCLRERVR